MALIVSTKFSRHTGKSDSHLSVADIVNEVEKLTDGLKNAPIKKAAQSVDELPFDAPEDAKGAYWRGSIYFVADNIFSAKDARDVFAHEVIGHFGLHGFFGNKLNPVLDAIHKNNLHSQGRRNQAYLRTR